MVSALYGRVSTIFFVMIKDYETTCSNSCLSMNLLFDFVVSKYVVIAISTIELT